MRPVGLLRARARSRAGVLGVLALLVATVAGVGGVVVVAAGTSAVATARELLASAPDGDAALVVRTRLGADPEHQQAALERALRDRFGAVPLAVGRSLASPPLRGADDAAGRVVLRTAAADAGDALPVVPGPGEAVVADDVAAALGVAAGDVLALEDGDLTVVTTPGDAVDAAAPAGTGAPGAGSDVRGPLVVAEETLLDLVDAPFVEWTVRPVVAAAGVDDLRRLADAGAALEPVLARADGLAVRGLTVEGDLPATAARAAQAATTVRTAGLVPVLLLAVVAAVAVGQVVRLVVRVRGGEVGVLLGRGADPARLVRWAAAEAAAVAGAGAVVGGVSAVLVAGGGRPDPAHVPAVAATALVTAALAVAVTGATTARQVLSSARVDGDARRARLRGVATVASVLGAPLVAALTSWRLLRADGVRGDASSADLLAVAAPAAVLVALALVGLVLLVPLSRAGELVTARRPPLVPAYVARQVARRQGQHAAAAVLLVLAVGTVSVAAAYAASVARHRGDLAALEAGSDVRVALGSEAGARGRDAAAVPSAPYAGVADVAAAASVLRDRATIADGQVAVTALPVSRADAVVRAPVDLGPHVEALTGAVDGAGSGTRPALPAGATALEVEVRVALDAGPGAAVGPSAVPVDVAAWLADPDGGLTRLDLGAVAPGGSGTAPAVLRADLPGAGPYRLAALDVGARAAGGTLEAEAVRLAAAAPGGAVDVPLPTTAWQVAPAAGTGVEDAEGVGAVGVRAVLGAAPDGGPAPASVRLLPPASDGVPAVVTPALAERADLAPGDRVRAALAGPEVVLRVVGVVDAVPGVLDAEAVLVDLDALGQGLLHDRSTPVLPDEVWLAVDEGAPATAVAEAAAALAGPGAAATTATTTGADAGAPVVDAFWTTAGAAVALALTGVAAVAVALVRARRREVVVLRAVGQTPAAQARARAAEHLAVALPAVAVGALAGAATSLALVPPLVRSTVLAPGPLPVRLAADTSGAAVLVLVLLLGLTAVAVGAALRVRGQALDHEHREEVA
ncbi:FtsX-like permease family protein [Cellulomonas telluris]|uniref:FtsX-like permease family protein n=1 Tax=Cellulomonas telluris TaxID=2306636 RepID=UPI0010A8D109|nr:FtsX-like permease family protein [Cellulomonas telluris]